MTSITFRAPMILGALVFVAACGDSKAAADSAAARDLALAGQGSAANPQLNDAPKSAAKKPSAPSKPAAPTSGTIAAGTTFTLSVANQICTSTNKAGDTFTATTTQSVNGSNGVSIPSGAVVTFSISKLNRSENANDPIEMVFVPTGIAFGGRSYAMDGAINPGFHVDKVKANPTGATAKQVAGGAAVGAIAGQMIGKNTKSTIIGAAAGAAAGAGMAAATSNYDGCLRPNTALSVLLSTGLQIPTV